MTAAPETRTFRFPRPRAAAAFPWLALVGLLVAPADVAAQFPGTRVFHEFGSTAIGITGGFQHWSLSGLERALDERSAHFEEDGFQLESSGFPLTFSYGVELQFRVRRDWFVRSQFEWTRLTWKDRDRQFLSSLGGTERSPVSISIESRVRSRPLLITLGGGRALNLEAVRLALSVNAIIAPVRVEDVLEIALGTAPSESRVVATGTGLGLEGTFALDYYTEVRTTLYLELFARLGAANVELEDPSFESSNLPGTRRVDFSGVGIRLGMRFL